MHGSCTWSQFIRSSAGSKCFRLTQYLPESARFETDPQDIQRPAPKRCFSQEFHQCSTANPSKHATYIKYLLCNMHHSIFTLTQRPAKSGREHGGLQVARALRRPPPVTSPSFFHFAAITPHPTHAAAACCCYSSICYSRHSLIVN